MIAKSTSNVVTLEAYQRSSAKRGCREQDRSVRARILSGEDAITNHELYGGALRAEVDVDALRRALRIVEVLRRGSAAVVERRFDACIHVTNARVERQGPVRRRRRRREGDRDVGAICKIHIPAGA